MRKRVAGATLLVAIGIGIWLSSLFKGLGPGGEGTGIGRSDNVSVSVESRKDGTQDASDRHERTSLPAGSVPTVLIDGHQYLLQFGSGGEESFRSAELDEVVRLARQARPAEDGVRVHVKRRQSARATAETALYDALQQSGIEAHAIHEQKAFVE